MVPYKFFVAQLELLVLNLKVIDSPGEQVLLLIHLLAFLPKLDYPLEDCQFGLFSDSLGLLILLRGLLEVWHHQFVWLGQVLPLYGLMTASN